MLHFTNPTDAQKVCECLASPVRLEILKCVLTHRAESLSSLADTLHLTCGAITQHIKIMCDAGLIKLVEKPGKRGVAKRCVPVADRIIIDVAPDIENESEYEFDLPLGSFSSAVIKPYCGIATQNGWLGERDDPRYFTFPGRAEAALVYFNSGKISWVLPTPPDKGKLSAIFVSFEISSKPYGHGKSRETETEFFFGDVSVGSAVVKGEFTDRKGLFTPPMFNDMCQYGKYRTVRIDKSGSYFDGIKLSSHTVDELDTAALGFSIASENGVALFGKGYGDYNSGLKVRLEY